jgi:hypothetical protein
MSLVASVSDLATSAATVGLFLVAVATAGVAYVTYRSQHAERRGRWMLELAREFADDEVFRRVRSDLYRGDDSRIARLLALKNQARDHSRSLSEPDADLLMSLDDYLGFFEVIERLVAQGQMSSDEASRLFGWYLQQALDQPEVRVETCLYFIPVVRLARLLGLRAQASQALREANSQIYRASRAVLLGEDAHHVPDHANSYIYRTITKTPGGQVTALYFCECGDSRCSSERRLALGEYERERGSEVGILQAGHRLAPANHALPGARADGVRAGQASH